MNFKVKTKRDFPNFVAFSKYMNFINDCKRIQNDFHLIVCGSSSGTLFLKTYFYVQVLFMVNLACCSFLVCFFLHHIAWKKKRKTLLYKLQNIPKNANILVKISISVIDGSKKVCIGQPICSLQPFL